MKPAHEIASRIRQTTSSETSDSQQPDTSRTQKIFTRLAAMYGNTWLSQMQNENLSRLMLAEWTDGLRDFTDDQIDRGLKNLEVEFPPSLPAFKKCCLTLNKHKSHEIYQALPKPKPDTQKAEKAFSEIRRIMNEAQ